jgi:L-threonylcarbamoyladenylate synthase
MAKPTPQKLAEALLAAVARGHVCLHPTDTIPGFCYDSAQQIAHEHLLAVKGRDQTKAMVNLISNAETALSFWQPLPAKWDSALRRIWPAPLTVVWKASDHARKLFGCVGEDGTIAMRVPVFSKTAQWMQLVLDALQRPLPSTSVNRSGEPPATTWDTAVICAREISSDIYIPQFCNEHDESEPKSPSTLIRIRDDAGFDILREGAYSVSEIKKVLAHV